MPRIILLLLILAALAILAVQNLSTAVSLVILGSSKTPAIPFGLLLVGTICLGALITLILYGLVGLQRPPESKYRPLGRRVPYPETPRDTSHSGAPYSPASPYASTSNSSSSHSSSSPRSSSTAFVSEPKAPQDSTPNQPKSQQESQPKSQQSQDSYSQTSVSPLISDYSEPLPSPEPPFTVRKPPFFFRGDKTEKKKGKRQDSIKNTRENRRIGDDWGEIRTAEHLNSWDVGSNKAQNSAAQNSDYAANDDRPNNYRTGADHGYDDGYDDGYDEDLDSGWENFESYDSPLSDRSNDHLEGPMDSSLNGPDSPNNRGRRIYRDGLYDDRRDQVYRDQTYREEGYEEEDDVYEADYRVIVPPSKPLDVGEDDYRA